MTPLRVDDVVRLKPWYLFRWEASQEAHVLLYPEGVVKLSPTAAEILERCTGRRVGDILAELTARFGDDDITADVMEFMEEARDRGWIQVA